MIKQPVSRSRSAREGFTLIELLVVVLIIGILAAIAVPQYFRVVEKGRVAEALSYVQDLKGAQERALLKTGSYVLVGNTLDITPATMKAFNPSVITPVGGTTPSWAITITRKTAVPTYGAYAITYNSATGFTCNNDSCTTDLLP